MKLTLLEQNFIGESVAITTTLRTSVVTPDGEMVEVPLLYEGVVLDIDKEGLLLDAAPNGTVRLVMRDKIVDIEIVDDLELDIPGKPPKRDMN